MFRGEVHVCAENRLIVAARLFTTGSTPATESTTTVLTPEVSV